jgi:hypothetical protein
VVCLMLTCSGLYVLVRSFRGWAQSGDYCLAEQQIGVQVLQLQPTGIRKQSRVRYSGVYGVGTETILLVMMLLLYE